MVVKKKLAAEGAKDVAAAGIKPITAQPVGEKFAVPTRGDVEYNRVVENIGCYRRMPTCRD